ncbi:hypothetical protein [Haloarcula salinisoli]|uniref:Uncharacterized protein n=1 Tax=Haloarcula salinisoli TaxID=2487746 RepID=A0A8J7YKX5_9EURY|nr:hypothetical protein [Halomicroarcula salinisoli]MBX0287347.1 hypothetical protein [Halomicroarcula salinisoli]MBX0305079.1 hypothetical protein [Halomicroarcula salinisoli]
MRWVVTSLIVTAALVVATGGALAVQGGPAWAEEFQGDLERGAAAHNAWADSEDPQFVGDRFVRNERVSLTVSGADGGEAVYGVWTDDEMRITDVSRGPPQDETMRVFASKPALEEVLRAENPATAFGEAVASGDVRVERMVGVGGHELAVGPIGALLGLAGLGLGAGLLGVVGLGTLLAGPGHLVSRGAGVLRAAVRRILDGLRWLAKVLGKLFLIVELLQLLGYEVRDRMKAAIRRVRLRVQARWLSLRKRLDTRALDERDNGSRMHSKMGTLRARLATVRNMRERDEQAGEARAHGDESQ